MPPGSPDAPGPAATAAATRAHPPGGDSAFHPPPASRVWLWIVAAFALQLAAWATWFVIAAQHRVAEVPLETAGGHKH